MTAGLATRTAKLVFTALLTALICVAAPFSIPVGAVPISFATLAIYIAASTAGWKRGTLAVLAYLLLGAAGLPVFSGFSGGIQQLAGVTGGYIIGYIPCALVTGLICDRLEGKRLAAPLGMIAGTVCCYLLGTLWFSLMTGTGFVQALAICVLPFLPGDAGKILVASCVARVLRPVVGRMTAGRSR